MNVPPPYKFIYSTGGPTGEVHQVDESTGGFGVKVEEIFFVKKEDLEKADKTRAALVSTAPFTRFLYKHFSWNRGMGHTRSSLLLTCDSLLCPFLEPIRLKFTITTQPMANLLISHQ